MTLPGYILVRSDGLPAYGFCGRIDVCPAPDAAALRSCLASAYGPLTWRAVDLVITDRPVKLAGEGGVT